MGLNWNRRLWLALAAASGFVSVAAGAFGAHGVADPQAKEWLRTGAQYEAVHALASFAAALVVQWGGRAARLTPPLFLAGSVFFSGSLYAMALGGPRILGTVTPIGGLMFLIGWAMLAWAAARSEPPTRA